MQTSLQRVGRALRRNMTRLTRSPFAATGPHPLIVHSCYHKAGTVWFQNVLTAVGMQYGLKLLAQSKRKDDATWTRARAGRHILLDHHSTIDLTVLPSFVGSHMVRDPRDMVVSGYFYHLKTNEEWALVPRERWGGLSYQDYLRQFDKEAGIAEEIKRFAADGVRRMISWNYADPRFLELRYEEHLADEETSFARLFRHYGFHDEAVALSTEIALGFSLSRQKGKLKHIRSGRPNEWQEHFTPDLKTLFKEATGDAALALGYETSPDW